jgi:hypothetical protein
MRGKKALELTNRLIEGLDLEGEYSHGRSLALNTYRGKFFGTDINGVEYRQDVEGENAIWVGGSRDSSKRIGNLVFSFKDIVKDRFEAWNALISVIPSIDRLPEQEPITGQDIVFGSLPDELEKLRLNLVLGESPKVYKVNTKGLYWSTGNVYGVDYRADRLRSKTFEHLVEGVLTLTDARPVIAPDTITLV